MTRDIFISTQTGLFRGRVNGTIAEIQPLGLSEFGTVLCVAIDVRNPDRVYAGTRRGGLFRSDDRGKTWHEKNDGLTYKEAWSLAQHPSTGQLFLGTGPAAVFTSNDAGDHWTFCEKLHALPETIDWTFPNPPHIAHVKGLGLYKADPKLILGAIEEGWLVRSEDGGATWTTLKSGTNFDSHTVTVMPNDPRIVVSTSGDGIYRSEDGGDHFVPANDGLTRRYCSQLVVHEDEPSILFTAAAEVSPGGWRRPEGANSRFFRSEDQGKTWKPLSGGGLPDYMTEAPRATAGRPDQAGSFLVGMNDGSIWMTVDHGETFAHIASGLPAIYGLAVAPGTSRT